MQFTATCAGGAIAYERVEVLVLVLYLALRQGRSVAHLTVYMYPMTIVDTIGYPDVLSFYL